MSVGTIMVVDDHATNLKLACDVLAVEGFTVIHAMDADQALARLAESTPDLILMDIELPGMDGLSLTRQLKSDERYRSIPIVAMTAYAMKGDDAKALAAGCDGYLSKPIDVRQFPRQVLAFLKNS